MIVLGDIKCSPKCRACKLQGALLLCTTPTSFSLHVLFYQKMPSKSNPQNHFHPTNPFLLLNFLLFLKKIFFLHTPFSFHPFVYFKGNNSDFLYSQIILVLLFLSISVFFFFFLVFCKMGILKRSSSSSLSVILYPLTRFTIFYWKNK